MGFRKPEKDFIGKDSIFSFISDMIEEVNYCKKIIKKEMKKELAICKKNEKGFRKTEKF